MTAQRSWLFLDHAVASIVSNISSPNTSRPVYTTLCNQNKQGEIYLGLDATGKGVSPTVLPLGKMCEHGGTTPVRGDAVRFVWHNFTSYVIKGNAGGRMHIDCSLLTGDYFRIATVHRNASGRLFRLSYEHPLSSSSAGRPANKASNAFGYVVLPNTPVPNITDESTVTMETGNNASDAAHVMTNSSAGVASVVFWQPDAHAAVRIGGHLLNLSASVPCLVLLRAEDGGRRFSVSASSPDQPGRTLTLDFNGLRLAQVSGGGCSLAGGGSAVAVQLPSGDRSGNSTTCKATLSSH